MASFKSGASEVVQSPARGASDDAAMAPLVPGARAERVHSPPPEGVWVGRDEETFKAAPASDIDELNRARQADIQAEEARLGRPLTPAEELHLSSEAQDTLRALSASRCAKNETIANVRAAEAVLGGYATDDDIPDDDVLRPLVDSVRRSAHDFAAGDIALDTMPLVENLERDVEARDTAGRVGLELVRAVKTLVDAGVSEAALLELGTYSGLPAIVASCEVATAAILRCQDTAGGVAAWIRDQEYVDMLERVPADMVLPVAAIMEEAELVDSDCEACSEDPGEAAMTELPEDVERAAMEEVLATATDIRELLHKVQKKDMKTAASKRWVPDEVDCLKRIYAGALGPRWFESVGQDSRGRQHSDQQKLVVEALRELGFTRTTASVRSQVVRIAQGLLQGASASPEGLVEELPGEGVQQVHPTK